MMAITRSHIYPRAAAGRIAAALADTPVVMVNGPRQCGKTTLGRTMEEPERIYVTLDDETTLAAAQTDPTGFIRNLDCAIIDEVRRALDLLRAIKNPKAPSARLSSGVARHAGIAVVGIRPCLRVSSSTNAFVMPVDMCSANAPDNERFSSRA